MMKHSSVFAMGVVMALAGCASGPKKADQNQASQPQPVVQESVETQGQIPNQIGQQSVSQGQTMMPVTRRITRTEITEKQIPTVNYKQAQVDINRMSADNFTALGFTPDVSQRIVQTRAALPGGFTSVSQLSLVSGIDQNLLAQLTPQLGTSGVVQQAGTMGTVPAQQAGTQGTVPAQQAGTQGTVPAQQAGTAPGQPIPVSPQVQTAPAPQPEIAH